MSKKDPPGTPPPPGAEPRGGADPLATIVAERLKRLLARRRSSFEKLAEASGIGIGELLRIEAGLTTPTLSHLWRMANALGVSFGSLVATRERQGVLVIRQNQTPKIGSRDGAFVSRPLFPYDCSRPVEFYEIVLGPKHIEKAEAHGAGAKENLVVARGEVEIVVGREPAVRLREGDAVDFLADVPHSYRNLGETPALLYLVMSYEHETGAAHCG